MILSASRRCDIPAFGMDGFIADLAAGHVDVRNPFDARRLRRVSLDPKDIDCLVFWTRDPRPLLARHGELGELRDRFIILVTITGYPRSLEPRVAPTGAAIEALHALAARIGPERVFWRYDPVILAQGLDPDWQLSNFARLAEALEGGAKRVTLSLLDEYAATTGRLARAGFADPQYGSPRKRAGLAGPSRDGVPGPERSEGPEAAPSRLPPPPWPELLAALAEIARGRGFQPVACAEPWDLAPLGIAKKPCIDGELLGRLFGRAVPTTRDRGQRPDCACAPSVDIGVYGSCRADCAYCYARRGGSQPIRPPT